ncbi:hypothetical protein N656DRAFT_790084 [Canariomyces notabilis]|uniref:Uncharacterized protein n=1 Tax=Canariomyces notabilis TaxID=2074819 RepID=A0AAN6TCM4_9PEZI|nr:hypothetical protein N656DRAFT_790084 [Canariomyces arenarius]
MDPASRPRSPANDLRHALKVMSCGGMIGTAILFPLANAEGLPFRFVTLAIFVITALAFHALHLQPFVRFGPFTAAVAILLLIVAVLSSGSSRKELIPWLPLFIVASSLITVALHKMAQHMAPGRLSIAANSECDFSGVSIGERSELSLRTILSPQAPVPALESNRFNPLYFGRYGPSSRTSQRTTTTGTGLSLSSVEGQVQPHWDSSIRRFFAQDTSPGQACPEETHAVNSQEPGGGLDSDPDSDSEIGTVESRRPLL